MNTQHGIISNQEISKQQPSRLSAVINVFFHPISVQELRKIQNELTFNIIKAEKTLQFAKKQNIQITNALQATLILLH